MLLDSWPAGFDRFLVRDGALNILIYIPIGLFGSLWMRRRYTAAVAACLTLAFATVLSATMEMTQLFDDGRQCSTADLATNVAGAALGIWLAWVYGKAVAQTVAGMEARRILWPSDVLLLLCCWVGYQVYPAIPHLSTWQLGVKLKSLWPPWPLSLVQTFGSVIDWLVVARLLDSLKAAHFLPVVLLLLPARLLILERRLTWPEVVGAVLAWVFWNSWVARYKQRTMLLAWLATMLLLLRGLSPYTPSTPVLFSWVPFASFLNQDQTEAALVFLNKSFLYGTVLWLLREAGYSLVAATIGIATLLGMIEAIQVRLPGRTPEITDPVYALILGLVLGSLDSAHRHTRAAVDHSAARPG
jgi:VanZ family protein